MASAARSLRRHLPIYPFILPTVALLLVFVYYPVASAVYHSFFEWDGVNERFIGLGNFVEMAQDERFVASLLNIGKLALFAVTVPIIVPVLVAEVIFNLRLPRVQYFFRVLFVIPMVVPYIVIILMWGFIYDPSVGLLNATLGLLGISGEAWLGSQTTVLYAIMGIGFPWVSGFNLLICLAGLYNIPPTILEAGRVDGASHWQLFRQIALPLSRPVLVTVAIIDLLNIWNDYIWPLTTIQDQKLMTLTVGIVSFQGQFITRYGPMMAGYVIASIPLIVVFFLFMRAFIQGMTSGALKM